MSVSSSAFHSRLSNVLARAADVIGVPVVYYDGGTALPEFQAGPPVYSTSPEALLAKFESGAPLTVQIDINPDDVAAPEIEADYFTLAGLTWKVVETVPAPSGWHHVTARAARRTTRGRGDARERV